MAEDQLSNTAVKDDLSEVNARDRAALISHARYDNTIDVSDMAANTFTSETLVSFDCTKPGANTFIDLKAASVSEITLNGIPVDITKWDGTRIWLDNLKAHDNTLRVRSVHTYADDGQGLTRVVDDEDGRPYLHTQFEHFSAHTVFACFDQPDIKATFRWSITAPDGWTVLNNKPEITHTPSGPGAATWKFPESETLSTYLAAFVGGPFHVFTTDPFITKDGRSIPIAIYCRESQAATLAPDVEEWFSWLKGKDGQPGALRILGDYTGIEFPYSQLLQVIVPGFQAGAMENAGLVTYAESVILRGAVPLSRREWRANAVVHETVHQWFGDLVSPRWWNGIWLNESFATWGASEITPLVSVYRNGKIQSNDAKQSAATLDQKTTSHPVDQAILSTSVVDEVFDPITYEKGDAVVSQLGASVGEDVVWRGLREFYFPVLREGNADPQDFLNAVGRAAGPGFDVADWAAQWLEQAGINVLSPQFTVDADGNLQGFSVLQAAAKPFAPQLRQHTLRIGLFDKQPDGSIARRTSVQLKVDGPVTPAPGLDGQKAPDLVLINDGDLTYTKITLDARSLDTIKSALGGVTDALARKQLWTALWDMTRDGQLPAQDYVTIAARWTASEPDLTTVESVLYNARIAIGEYVDKPQRDGLRALLSSLAFQNLSSGVGNAQTQASWMAVWAGTATRRDDRSRRDQTAVDFMNGLLDGTETLPNVDVRPGTEMRWRLLLALAISGDISRTRIDSETTLDPSLQGKAMALTCAAALPAPGAKAEAYRIITKSSPQEGDPQLTPQNLRALISGFMSGDEDLLERYTADYPRMVADACRSRSEKDVATLVEGMFPRASAAALAAADAALADPTLSKSAKRYVAEGRDDAVRGLAAQAVSRQAYLAPQGVGLG